ncbi:MULTISPECIES: hypothetical protein [Nonlabens]|uniref:hypothetical protein n=1 Tax=Nonlabens TaxID=363408 RepID=UPI000CF37475|nr:MULTISPECIES: hypothetical protein [Nonlabens]PQJ17254.1 hypothetical protein BST93_11430 [Nonlabens tegetincola]
MTKEKYLQDIAEIKNIMNRSTRFISLSGLSGILAGFYAIIGGIIGFFILQRAQINGYTDSFDRMISTPFNQNTSVQIILVAIVVLVLAVITAFFLTKAKAKKYNQKIWTKQSIRLVLNFLAPLSIGGLFTLIMLYYGFIGLVAPCMLIFYGLACMNASHFTLGTVKYLGLTCAILGLLNLVFIGYGLYFWVAGFGICHILYGSIMYIKYDKQ